MTKVLAVFGLLVIILWALPVQAEMAAMADSDLATITGKAGSANDYTFTGDSADSLIGGDANVQWGWYQWSDVHTTDVSDHKGANDSSADGAAGNSVQENVVALTNAINWGGYTYLTNNSDIASDQEIMPYAVFGVGGF